MISAQPDSLVLYRCGHVILLCVLKLNTVESPAVTKMEVEGRGGSVQVASAAQGLMVHADVNVQHYQILQLGGRRERCWDVCVLARLITSVGLLFTPSCLYHISTHLCACNLFCIGA